MRVSDAIALVTVDVGNGSAAAGALRGLAAAFRAAGRPVVHAVETDLAASLAPAAASGLDMELLAAGGVQTLAPAEMAIGLGGRTVRENALERVAEPRQGGAHLFLVDFELEGFADSAECPPTGSPLAVPARR